MVEQAKTDPDAFAVLYRSYVGKIYGFAYKRSGSKDVAEDVTSATFERAWRALAAFEWKGGGFEPWLYRIASREILEWYRREGRPHTARAQMGLRELLPSDVDSEQGVDLERLRAAIATLRPRYQEAINNRFFTDLSAGDQAAALSCSKAGLAVTVHRAIASLRRAYEGASREGPP
ncbi:MAG: hypothetical protein NVS3B21_26390 [Acidimicrobiales bacterium]